MKTKVKKFIYKLKTRGVKIPFYLNKDVYTSNIFVASIVLLLLNIVFLAVNFSQMPEQIPLWYSLPWGPYRLSVARYIFLIPFFNLVFLFITGYLCNIFLKNNIKDASKFISSTMLLATVAFTVSSLTIVNKTVLKSFEFSPWVVMYLVPTIIAFVITRIMAGVVIRNAEKLKVMEYPHLRMEPAKILQKPTPRGGAIAFFVGFAVTTAIFLSTSQRAWGLIIGTSITTLTGYLDDRYKLNFLPRLLFLLPFAFIVVILSGFVMMYIPNPFGDPIMLDGLRFSFNLFGDRSIVIYGALISFVWFMWMANMISWNNGTDGQFVAITIPLTIVIAFLSFRFGSLTYEQQLSAQIAFITLGALLGMVRVTFPPNKLIWGFGATGVGLILASLSILNGTRVATALLVLLVPSIDVIYVLYSRIKAGKNPFMGDRNHLHHKLIDLGWSKKKIAFFYWGVSIAFAALAVLLSGKSKLLALVTVSGLLLYGLVVVRRYAGRLSKV